MRTLYLFCIFAFLFTTLFALFIHLFIHLFIYLSIYMFSFLIFSLLKCISINHSFFFRHSYFFVLFSFFFFPSLYFILTILFFLSNLEMTRAMASVPTVRLPMENPPEGYWEECDLGVCDKKKVLDSNLQ